MLVNKRLTLLTCQAVVSHGAGYAFDKLINSNLCLQVFDYDRFSKDDIIGEVVLPMTPADLVNGLDLWKHLQPSHAHMVCCIIHFLYLPSSLIN